MECCGPGYASPQDAILAPREKLLYTILNQSLALAIDFNISNRNQLEASCSDTNMRGFGCFLVFGCRFEVVDVKYWIVMCHCQFDLLFIVVSLHV